MNIPEAYYKIINCIDSAETAPQLESCERMVINFPPYALCKWELVNYLENKRYRIASKELIDRCWQLAKETLWLTENL